MPPVSGGKDGARWIDASKLYVEKAINNEPGCQVGYRTQNYTHEAWAQKMQKAKKNGERVAWIKPGSKWDNGAEERIRYIGVVFMARQ